MEKLISIHEGDSIGSIFKVEIAHKDDFLIFNESEILFRENRDWKLLEHTDETGELSFNENETNEGLLSAYEGSFSFHGPIRAISSAMRPYLGRKSVLRVTTHNHEVFIIGHPEDPALISTGAGTGSSYTDRSLAVYSFSSEAAFEVNAL